jgi:hypothetical protein
MRGMPRRGTITAPGATPAAQGRQAASRKARWAEWRTPCLPGARAPRAGPRPSAGAQAPWPNSRTMGTGSRSCRRTGSRAARGVHGAPAPPARRGVDLGAHRGHALHSTAPEGRRPGSSTVAAHAHGVGSKAAPGPRAWARPRRGGLQAAQGATSAAGPRRCAPRPSPAGVGTSTASPGHRVSPSNCPPGPKRRQMTRATSGPQGRAQAGARQSGPRPARSSSPKADVEREHARQGPAGWKVIISRRPPARRGGHVVALFQGQAAQAPLPWKVSAATSRRRRSSCGCCATSGPRGCAA